MLWDSNNNEISLFTPSFVSSSFCVLRKKRFILIECILIDRVAILMSLVKKRMNSCAWLDIVHFMNLWQLKTKI